MQFPQELERAVPRPRVGGFLAGDTGECAICAVIEVGDGGADGGTEVGFVILVNCVVYGVVEDGGFDGGAAPLAPFGCDHFLDQVALSGALGLIFIEVLPVGR